MHYTGITNAENILELSTFDTLILCSQYGSLQNKSIKHQISFKLQINQGEI